MQSVSIYCILNFELSFFVLIFTFYIFMQRYPRYSLRSFEMEGIKSSSCYTYRDGQYLQYFQAKYFSDLSRR